MKSLIRNISIMIFMTVVFFLLFEVIARIGMAVYTKNKEYLTYFHKFEPIKVYNLKMESYLKGKDLYYKGISDLSYRDDGNYTVAYNSKGYRTAEFKKTKSLFRIACFGGSSTWGAGNNNDETWPFYLQQYIDSSFSNKYEIINAGFGGYTTSLILNLIKNEFVNYNPDMIIIYNGYNEHTGGQPVLFSNNPKTQLLLHNIHRFISKKSVFYYTLNKLYSKGNPLDMIGTGKRISGTYERNMEDIIKICEARDIRLIIVKQPLYVKSLKMSSAEPGHLYTKHYKNPYFNEKTFNRIQDDIKNKKFYTKYARTYYYQSLIFKEIDKIKHRHRDIVMIDVVNRLISEHEEGKTLFNDVVHLNSEGNKFLAEEIFQGLIFEDLVENIEDIHSQSSKETIEFP